MHIIDLKPELNNDLLVLITCCQNELTKEDTQFILDYIQTRPLDYDVLITLSYRHGVLPLVHKTLKQLSSTYPLPSELCALLKRQNMTIAQQNMRMTAELICIMKLLEENGIRALAFKGPTLSQMAYGDITLRQYVDLDILVKKEDIYKIDTLLKQYKYKRLLTLTPVQEKIWFTYAHDLGFIHPNNGIHLEIHWSLLDEDYPMQVNLEDFWEKPQEFTLKGQLTKTFSNENLIVYLAIHGSKHLWERLEWIKDIDLLIQKHTIDWDQVIKKVSGTGFEKMVYLGLELSTQLFSTPIPESIQSEILQYSQREQMIPFIFKNWNTPQSTIQKTHAMLKLFPTVKHKLHYLHKIILKPSFNEYWFIDLPKGLYWIYYLVRPYLLFKKYFLPKID